MNLLKPTTVWYNSVPPSGEIYCLADIATSGQSKGERLGAVGALGKIGDPRAVRPLIDLLNDTDPEIRAAVTASLGELKSGRSIEALTGLLRDRGERVSIRKQAVISLAAIRTTGATDVLEKFIADQEEDPAVREFASDVLTRIGNL